MLKCQPLKSNSANGASSIKYLTATEYYISKDGEEKSPSFWHGKAVDSFEINSAFVKNEDIELLANGCDPRTGAPLVRNAFTEERRVGSDMTFSAPKSVSVLYASADQATRDKILAAQEKAVKTVMQYIEERATYRTTDPLTKERTKVPVQGLVSAGFTHFANRNLDPALHTHTVVMNLCLKQDGTYGAFDTDLLFHVQKAGDALYLNTLAAELQTLGFNIERDDVIERKTGRVVDTYFEVAGIPEDLIDKYSSRRKEMIAYAAEHGVDMNEAWNRTRKLKDEPSYAELLHTWENTFKEMNEAEPGKVPTIEELMLCQAKADRKPQARDDLDLLLELHANQSMFNEYDLMNIIGREYIGLLSGEQLTAKIEEFKQANNLIEVQADENGLRRFTSEYMLEMELDIRDRTVAYNDSSRHILHEIQLEGSIKKFEDSKGSQLSSEQRKAAQHVVYEKGCISVIEGWAGTGKTFGALAFLHAYKDAGYQLLGTAQATKAATQLGEDTVDVGMKCFNAAKLLVEIDSGKVVVDEKTILVVDEFGMVDVPTFHRLQKHFLQAGAKMICMGDTNQLQAVGAGGAMSIVKEVTGAVELSGIQRQESIENRVVASLFYGLDKDLVTEINKVEFEITGLEIRQAAMQHEIKGPADFKAIMKSQGIRYTDAVLAYNNIQVSDQGVTFEPITAEQIQTELQEKQILKKELEERRIDLASKSQDLDIDGEALVERMMDNKQIEVVGYTQDHYKLAKLNKELQRLVASIPSNIPMIEVTELDPTVNDPSETTGLTKAYHAVATNNHKELARLIQHGADINQRTEELDQSLINKAIKDYLGINKKKIATDTTETIRILIANGAELGQEERGLLEQAPELKYQVDDLLVQVQQINSSRTKLSDDIQDTSAKIKKAEELALKGGAKLTQAEERENAMQLLLDDYFKDTNPVEQKLVIAGTNEEVRALNYAIRERLKKDGVVAEKDYTVEVELDNKNKAQERFSVGDRIVFTRNSSKGEISKGGKVQNGLEGKITDITVDQKGKMNITVEAANGSTYSFNPKKYCDFRHSLAMTVHKSQGQSKQSVYCLANPQMMDRHWLLVAFTRTKDKFRMFSTEKQLEQIKESITVNNYKENAKDNLLADYQRDMTFTSNREKSVQVQQGLLRSALSQAEEVIEYIKSKFTTTEPEEPVVETVQPAKPLVVAKQKGIDEYNRDGYTQLYEAVKNSNLALIKHLVRTCGADINKGSLKYGHSPLYKAVLDNNLPAIQLLTSLGADWDAKDKFARKTPRSVLWTNTKAVLPAARLEIREYVQGIEKAKYKKIQKAEFFERKKLNQELRSVESLKSERVIKFSRAINKDIGGSLFLLDDENLVNSEFNFMTNKANLVDLEAEEIMKLPTKEEMAMIGVEVGKKEIERKGR